MAFGDAPFGTGPLGAEPGSPVLAAGTGVFVLTGPSTGLVLGYRLLAEKGIFDLKGLDTVFSARGEKGYTDHFREQTGSTTGDEPLYLVQIDHAQLAVPVRVVNDTQDLGRKRTGYNLRLPGFAVNDLPMTLDFDFTTGLTTPRVGYANLTCTRAGNSATRVNASGLIEVVQAHQHRINYDPVSLQCLGLLCEPTRNNTFLQSEQMQTAPNTSNNITISPNATISPSGLLNAASIGHTTLSNASMQQAGLTFTTGLVYTFSMYAKKKSLGNKFALRIQAYPNRAGAVFDLINGTIVGIEATGAGYAATAKIVDAGGGWWRCSATVTIGTTPANNVLWGPTDCIPANVSGWEGANSVLSDCYAWGGQVEFGGNATSYIPTTTTFITRNGDQPIMGVGSWYNPIKSTWVTEFNSSFFEVGNPRVIGFDTPGSQTPSSFVTGPNVASTWDAVDDSTTANAYVFGTNGRTASAYTARDSVLDYDFTHETLIAQVGPTLAPITVTRSGATATRINGIGLVEAVPADTPRFNHDPVTLLCKGLLIEELRTNELLRATEFDNAAWSNHGGDVALTTITANAAIAPDGTLTADKFTNAGQTTADFGRLQEGGSAFGTYTLSIWLKAGTLSNARIMIKDRGSDNIKGSLVAALTSTWQRFSISGVTAGSVPGWRIDISANAVNGDFYLWGGQVEAGPTATSFIYTTTVPVTRNADYPRIASVGSWFNQAEGTVAVEFDHANAPDVSVYHRIFELSPGTGSPLEVWLETVTNGLFAKDQKDNLQVLIGTVGAGTVHRVATVYKTGSSFGGSLNGAAPVFGTQILPATVTSISLGCSLGGGSSLNGHLRRFVYHDRKEADNELVTTSLTGSNAVDVALSLNGGTLTTNGTSNFGVPTLVYVGHAGGGNLSINGHVRKLSYFPSRADNLSVVEMARTAFATYPVYSENWIACVFRVQFPEDVAMTQPRIPISIDNVGRELTQWLEASNGGKGATVTIMQVMRDTPDVVEQSFTLNLLDSHQDIREVSANLGYSNVLDLPALTALQNTELQPGIF